MMQPPIGPFRLHVSVTFAPVRRKQWEELAAVGMDDCELARLNEANTAEPVYVRDNVRLRWRRR